jgi:hypothetical protein
MAIIKIQTLYYGVGTVSWMESGILYSKTWVSKLPPEDKQRILPDGKPTGVWHDTNNVVKSEYYTHRYGWVGDVNKCIDERSLIGEIIMFLMKNKFNIVYSKGYNGINYDYNAIRNSCDRCFPGFKGFKEIAQQMVFPGCTNPIEFRDATIDYPNVNKLWMKTTEQIQSGEYINNQKYMATGISHNIEDSRQLMELINKEMNKLNKLTRIQGDF